MTGIETPSVVREFMVGKTRIKIAEDFCSGKSDVDVAKALLEITRTAQAYLSAAAVGTQCKS